MDIYGYFDGVDLDMFDEFDGYLWICLLLFFFKLWLIRLEKLTIIMMCYT